MLFLLRLRLERCFKLHFLSKDCISSVSSPAGVCVQLNCKKWLLIHGVAQKNVIRDKIFPNLDRQGH